MCKHILVMVVGAIVAFMVPKQSHWIYQGNAPPNSTMVWYPSHTPSPGMCHIHFWGNGTVHVDGHTIDVDQHRYMFVYGPIPTVEYMSLDTPLKAELHLHV